jgi:hypothetical protein
MSMSPLAQAQAPSAPVQDRVVPRPADDAQDPPRALAESPLAYALPPCAVCKRPVERVTQIRDPRYDHVLFVAECHGEEQAVRLTYETSHLVSALAICEAFGSSPLSPWTNAGANNGTAR